MGNAPAPFGIDRSLPRLDGRDPYLSLHFVMIFVRDQERSLRFYLDQLGFRLLVDQTFEHGGRWIEVGLPDGGANIALAQATPGSDVYKLIGRDSQIYFVTEDVTAKYNEWSSRGVRFQFPPQAPAWGGIFTRFEDVDGNSFGLAGFDELTRTVEEHAARSHKRSNPTAAARRNWKSPPKCRPGCFRKSVLRRRPSNMQAFAFRPARSEGTTSTSSILAGNASAW